MRDGIRIVQWQGFRRKFASEDEGFTFSRVEAALAKRFCMGSAGQVPDMNPFALGGGHRAGNGESGSADNDFFKDRARDGDLIKEGTEQIEIAKSGEVTKGLLLEMAKPGYLAWRRLSNSSMALPSASQSSSV